MNGRDQYKEISSDELSQWIESGKNFYLIDVLVADHFQKIHLPKALQACVFEVTFTEQMKSITSDKSSKIVLYGSSRRSSSRRPSRMRSAI